MTVDEIAELTSQIAYIRRETVRPLLGQIRVELEREMVAVGLQFPVTISLPNGDGSTAIVSISSDTPDDPPIGDFEKTADILAKIVGRHLRTTIDHRAVSCGPSQPVTDQPVAAID